jgi:hypothetical protein
MSLLVREGAALPAQVSLFFPFLPFFAFSVVALAKGWRTLAETRQPAQRSNLGWLSGHWKPVFEGKHHRLHQLRKNETRGGKRCA